MQKPNSRQNRAYIDHYRIGKNDSGRPKNLRIMAKTSFFMIDIICHRSYFFTSLGAENKSSQKLI